MTKLSVRWTDLSLRAKGLVVVSIPLAALLVATFALYLVQQRENEEQDAVTEMFRVRSQIQTVLTLLIDAETGVRGYAISESPELLEPYTTAFARLPRALANLERLVGEDPSQAARAGRVRFLSGRRLEVLASVRRAAERRSEENQPAVLRGNELMTELREELAAMEAEAEADLGNRLADLEGSRDREGLIFASAVALGLAGGLLASVLFTTGIARRIGRLQKSARRLSTGDPLPDRPAGTDELGHLAQSLQEASDLLTDRERMLIEAKEKAERASWAKSDFLSRTNHELRTPVSVIIGFTHYLQRLDQGPEIKEISSAMSRAARHLAELVDDVMDIARIEAGELKCSLEPVAVSDVIDETIGLLTPLATERGVRIEVDDRSINGASVVADPRRLNQILINLVSNAIRYNRPDGTVAISCGVAPTGRSRISVADDGPGIPREKLDRLFVPYDRLDQSAAERGVGLGLTISRSLAELMNGSIEVESTVGRGSTFHVELASAPEVPTPSESK